MVSANVEICYTKQVIVRKTKRGASVSRTIVVVGIPQNPLVNTICFLITYKSISYNNNEYVVDRFMMNQKEKIWRVSYSRPYRSFTMARGDFIKHNTELTTDIKRIVKEWTIGLDLG